MSEQHSQNGYLKGFENDNSHILNYMPKEGLPVQELHIRVMDSETYRLIEIDKLYKAINFTKTRIGALALERSLMQPLTSLEVISAKQESLRELRDNPQLKEALLQYVETIAQQEDHLHDYFQGRYDRKSLTSSETDNKPSMYDTFKGAHQFLRHLGNGTEGIGASSDYLKFLLGALDSYRDSEVFEFVKGPVYATARGGLKTKKDTRMYIPSIKFRPKDLTVGRAIVTSMGGMAMGFGAIFAIDTARSFDDSTFVVPLRQLYFSDPHVANAIDSLGLIDELLSLDAYKDVVKVPTVLPTVTDSKTHHFVAKDLRNPVLIRQEKPYIPNDIELNGQKMTILTGPNSGGKTSLCKTIAQAQVLAQIGGYVPAKEASISVADGIFYHSPMVNSLQDQEGRFGAEVARTRDIFYKTTPKSLVILDELIEATTYEERLQHSYNILDGFWQIGGNTILVTHNHQLAEEFNKEGKGQFLQIEFNGRESTHKIIPGISTESHAEDVLIRLGFTKVDIQRHLERIKSMPITIAQEPVKEKDEHKKEDEQPEADRICREMYIECEELLNARGIIKSRPFSHGPFYTPLPFDKGRVMESSIQDNKEPKKVMVFSTKINPAKYSEIIVGTGDFQEGSEPFLSLEKNHGTIKQKHPKDTGFVYLIRRANLQDARRWKEVVDTLKTQSQTNQSAA